MMNSPLLRSGDFAYLLRQIAFGVCLFTGPLLHAENATTKWQEKALQAYPALGQPDSELNRAFLKLYQEKKASEPEFFQQPDWPWKLATQIAGQSGTPEALLEAPASPVGPPTSAATPVPVAIEDQSSEWEADNVPRELGLEFAKFQWWAPGGVKPRAILVLAPGRGGDGRGMAKDARWQAIAREYHLGIVACFLKNRADMPFAYQADPSGATSKLVDRAVEVLMTENGQLQMKIPLFFYGHSAGGNVSQNYGYQNPDRMLGAVLMRCPNGSGRYSPGKGNVPLLIYVGGKDRAEWVETSMKNYEEGLDQRALWTMAKHPNEGHGVGNTWELTAAFVNGVLNQRLGKPAPGSTTSPRKLSRQQGWLGDPETLEVAPANQFKGKKQQATWLPDEATALLWQSYLRQ